eukprot:13914326-Alexandrium_andersonii.AAC.1
MRRAPIVWPGPLVCGQLVDECSLREEELPVLVALAFRCATLLHDAHGLLQGAHEALRRVLPRLVLAAVGGMHVVLVQDAVDPRA